MAPRCPAWTEGMWETRDGRRVRLRDMSDEHLVGSLRFVEQHIEELPALAGARAVLQMELLRRASTSTAS